MGISVSLTQWLLDVRSRQVVDVVHADPRTNEDRSILLGVSKGRIFGEVIGGGQADFTLPWEHLTSIDRVLLYAYYNQRGHLEELTYVLGKFLPATEPRPQNPIVIDLGCGPFTGCLALAAVLGRDFPFTYIGVDRASSMHAIGERFAADAVQNKHMHDIQRIVALHLDHVQWHEPPRWRPVIIIVSYLMASPTLDVDELVIQVESALSRFGRGPVSIVYTNSDSPVRNAAFGAFRACLERHGFLLQASGIESIVINRYGGAKEQAFFFAIFNRPKQTTLRLR